MKDFATLYKNSHTTGKILLAMQLLAHAGLIVHICYASVGQWLIFAGVYFLIVCVGFSVTYHRLLAHRCWTAPEWIRKFGIVCGVFSAVGTPISFVSQHRNHHRSTDKPNDTYSIIHNPFWYVQWFTMLTPVSLRYAPDLLRDRFCVFIHRRFFHIHITAAVILFIVDPLAVVYAYLAPMAFAWNTINALNSITHQHKLRMGYYHNKIDSSANNLILGYLTFGEGWHSNHHNNPRNANFKKAWWEIDLGYAVIRALEKRKLHR